MNIRTNNWYVGTYRNKLDNSYAYFAPSEKKGC